ncbi:MAG TPA: SAM-dependent methyltransferase [Paenibacillaceae bacterium]|nr:SAM-dependent methyltransferase [Paenibacillaceae bacterium]
MSFQWHKECAKKWDSMSSNWQANSQEMWETGSRKTILTALTGLVTKGPILDAGCGDGYGSRKLAEMGYPVVGVDLSEEMILSAQCKLSPQLDLSFIQGDILNLPYPKESFQGIMAVNIIEWTQSPQQTLETFRTLLKPDGVLALGVLGPTAAPRQHSYARLHGQDVVCNTMMPWECERLLDETSLTILHQEGVYKRGVTEEMTNTLSRELCQSLSFLWMFYISPIQK